MTAGFILKAVILLVVGLAIGGVVGFALGGSTGASLVEVAVLIAWIVWLVRTWPRRQED